MKKSVLNFAFAMASMAINAQTPNLVWAKGFGDTLPSCCPYIPYAPSEVTVDLAGNVVSAGTFERPVDFDPGPGTYILTPPANERSMFVAKHDATGALLWAKQIDGNTVNCSDLEVDAAGNVYVCGAFYMTVDFDPGPAVDTKSAQGADAFLLKLTPAGNYVYSHLFSSDLYDYPNEIAIDNSDNVIIGGYFGEQFFTAVIDLDPGAAVSNSTTSGGEDGFLVKIDPAGNFVWGKTFGTSGPDAVNSLDNDVAGNVIAQVSGGVAGLDLDPGSGTFTLTGSSTGPGGNFLVKFDATGNFVSAYDAGDLFGQIATDNAGNLFLLGAFGGTIDLNPGPATNTVQSLVYTDGYIVKFDPAFNFTWGKALINLEGYVYPRELVTDANGNVYSSGFTEKLIDFDPGPGMDTVRGLGAYFWKLNQAGNDVWGFMIDGIGAVMNSGIATFQDNVYACSVMFGSPDLDPGPGVYTVTPASGVVMKLCEGPEKPSPISGTTLICNGYPAMYSVVSDTAATSYSWQFPSGWMGNTIGPSVSMLAGYAGVISVQALNACGPSFASTLEVSACNPVDELQGRNRRFAFAPNPSNGNFNVICDDEEEYGLSIINLMGQTVYTRAGLRGNTAIRSELVPGVYFCVTGNNEPPLRIVVN